MYYPAAVTRVNGANATLVYGKPNMTVCDWSPTLSASNMNAPAQGAIDPFGNMYLVGSEPDDRVLVFAGGAPPTRNHMAATQLLGQPTFKHPGHSTALNRFFVPWGVTYYSPSNTIWISDTNNRRVAVYKNVVLPFQSIDMPSLELVLLFEGHSPNVHMLPKGMAFVLTMIPQ